MFTSKFIALSFLAIVLFGLVWHRIFFSNRYANLLGLVSVFTFGAAYLFYPQTIASVFAASDSLQWFESLQLRKIFGAAFFLSTAYFINALIRYFVYQRRLTWEGDSKVPRLIQYVVTVVLYILAFTAILGVV